jgi:hypothetical protein
MVEKPPAVTAKSVRRKPRRTMLLPTSPTFTTKSFDAANTRKFASNWMNAPTPIAWKSCCAAWAPVCPAL